MIREKVGGEHSPIKNIQKIGIKILINLIWKIQLVGN